MTKHPAQRRFLAPEVVQTSMMDCGPASLKCLREGFGIPVSYGRLREACQTDVDGTSIDTMEQVAQQLGLDAEQVMLPVDHLLHRESNALPALVVTRHPNGTTHFVVVWRRHGRFVQVMDPATGRRWPGRAEVLHDLYVHSAAIPAAEWRAWAGTEGFLNVLRGRLADLKIGRWPCRDGSRRPLRTKAGARWPPSMRPRGWSARWSDRAGCAVESKPPI